MKWEPFPKPLSPKSPFTINDIGPLITLIVKVIIIITLYLAINRRGRGENVGERKTLRGRERKVISLSFCVENNPK